MTGDLAQAEVWIARHTPAAIVADVYLGNDLVWGFMAIVRDWFPTVPIILTSAHDESQQALDKGASVFLPKPLERETLLRELRRLTAQREYAACCLSTIMRSHATSFGNCWIDLGWT